ncbi:MAG: hypothetical protein WCD89_11685 [Anaerocolumna sp.]
MQGSTRTADSIIVEVDKLKSIIRQKLLHLLFEMPPERHHVWKVERKFK